MMTRQSQGPTQPTQRVSVNNTESIKEHGAGGPLKSSELFGTGRVRTIEHRGEYYYLRLTRSGKLILSK